MPYLEPFLDGNTAGSGDNSLLPQTNLEDDSMGFMPGFDYSWQLTETVQESLESGGLCISSRFKHERLSLFF